jgi:toxin ParE1/3/4
MSSLQLTPAAEEDLLDILNHIATHRPLTAKKWYETLRSKCEFLSQNPELGQCRPELDSECRSFSVNRWVIYYRIVGDGVEILRVLDGSRDVGALFADKRKI